LWLCGLVIPRRMRRIAGNVGCGKGISTRRNCISAKLIK
jgi:hypothetical protein